MGETDLSPSPGYTPAFLSCTVDCACVLNVQHGFLVKKLSSLDVFLRTLFSPSYSRWMGWDLDRVIVKFRSPWSSEQHSLGSRPQRPWFFRHPEAFFQWLLCEFILTDKLYRFLTRGSRFLQGCPSSIWELYYSKWRALVKWLSHDVFCLTLLPISQS